MDSNDSKFVKQLVSEIEPPPSAAVILHCINYSIICSVQVIFRHLLNQERNAIAIAHLYDAV